MQISTSTSPAPALRQSPADVLRKNGKSFYWARFFLSKESSAKATELYAFCRYLDDIADGDLPGGRARLRWLREQIIGALPAIDPHVSAFHDLIGNRPLAQQAADELLTGLIGDQDTVRFETERELIRYAYRVAGTVGILMTPFLGGRDERAYPFAIDLGIAMQLTNIARDVREDAGMGRRYIPAEWGADPDPSNLIDPDPSVIRTTRKAVLRLLDLAESYYTSGTAGLVFLSPNARRAIAVAAMVYREIGWKLRSTGTNWHHGRVKVSAWGKIRPSLSALLQSAGTAASPPWHDARLHNHLGGLPGADNGQ